MTQTLAPPDNIGGQLPSGAFQAYRSTAVSLATAAVIVYNTEDYDLNSWYDNTTGVYTPKQPGYYMLTWAAGIPTLTADQWIQANLQKNAVTDAGGSLGYWRTAAGGAFSNGATLVQANGTTDAFRVVTTHNSGATTAHYTGRAVMHFRGIMVA